MGALSPTEQKVLAAQAHKAQGFEAEELAGAKQSAMRRGWGLVLAAGVIAAQGVAISVLLPLKEFVPTVIRVNDTTGVVDRPPVLAGKADVKEIETRWALRHYVLARERYIKNQVPVDYLLVEAMNSEPLNVEWRALWDLNNTTSPLNRYLDGTVKTVDVSTINGPLPVQSGQRDLWQVRFTVTVRSPTGGTTKSDYVATIRITNIATDKDDDLRRAWNPLGFRVLSYIAEAEVAGGAKGS
ncbi:MAG: type IV secretion system protein [Burkholderiales bacterium]